jgi:carbonic anhydrase
VSADAQQVVLTAPEQVGHRAIGSQLETHEMLWAGLIEGNKRFVAGKLRNRNLVALRGSLANGQHPKIVVLTCSDSRVSPELLFDQSLGDLFVVRSAGNIADAISVGSIEYAVEHLGSTMLIILGHTKCGAVAAAYSGAKMPSRSLEAIVDKINPAIQRVGNSDKSDARMEAAIQENVRQIAMDVIAASDILRHQMEEQRLAVVQAEYQLDTGLVVRL